MSRGREETRSRREDGEAPPPDAAASRVAHRVPFYETDAMGVVHHSNFVRYLEEARIAWLDEHDRPYTAYVGEGFHFAVTRVEVDYLRAIRFDDVVEVAVWAEWVRGASLGMRYTLHVGDVLVATAVTEHASVDGEGRVVRIPKDRRKALQALVPRRDRQEP